MYARSLPASEVTDTGLGSRAFMLRYIHPGIAGSDLRCLKIRSPVAMFDLHLYVAGPAPRRPTAVLRPGVVSIGVAT